MHKEFKALINQKKCDNDDLQIVPDVCQKSSTIIDRSKSPRLNIEHDHDYVIMKSNNNNNKSSELLDANTDKKSLSEFEEYLQSNQCMATPPQMPIPFLKLRERFCYDSSYNYYGSQFAHLRGSPFLEEMARQYYHQQQQQQQQQQKQQQQQSDDSQRMEIQFNSNPVNLEFPNQPTFHQLTSNSNGNRPTYDVIKVDSDVRPLNDQEYTRFLFSESPEKWEMLECKTIKFRVEDQSTADDDDDDVKTGQQSSSIQNRKLIHIAKMLSNDDQKNRPIPIKYENNRLIVRQPFKILTDIWGVLVSYDFRRTLYKYIDDNLECYFRKNFHTESVKYYVEQLIQRTEEDLHKYSEMPMIISNNKINNVDDNGNCDEDLIKSIVNNLNYRRKSRDKSLMINLDTIFNQIWNEGQIYKQKFTANDPFFIKIYTFASGPLETQKLFLSASTEGNVSEWITSGFDAHHRFKYDTNKYRGVLSSLTEREAKNLFYMTDSPNKGRAARRTGMTVFIVQRPGNRHYSDDDLKSFPIINSFDQFEFIEFAAAGCC
ncbi:Enolase-phosphatase E1 [Dermatophagoides farinae]|uniref:Enolase-phosphatase E1 n=1 Tax=Dermatophagoides farinae TaxID=6954 RepID=A0A922HTA4_DERFA|nr:Enolase-phosphatase E1 [Dermatophagoides farinae]